jgi:hypothetical protein
MILNKYNKASLTPLPEIITERKQIKVPSVPGCKVSLNRDTYKNKWEFKYGLQWELNEQTVVEASKIDGIFPLVTNTDLKASDVLKKYKNRPSLEKRMYTKKPTWNNIRYFFRNIHYSEIFKDGICLQVIVKGLSLLHEQVISLLEVPVGIYKNLQNNWWQFKET